MVTLFIFNVKYCMGGGCKEKELDVEVGLGAMPTALSGHVLTCMSVTKFGGSGAVTGSSAPFAMATLGCVTKS